MHPTVTSFSIAREYVPSLAPTLVRTKSVHTDVVTSSIAGLTLIDIWKYNITIVNDNIIIIYNSKYITYKYLIKVHYSF